MKKTSMLIIASAFVMAACATVVDEQRRPGQGMPMGQMGQGGQGMPMGQMMMGMMSMMSQMDSNTDGMISKDEFMRYHEAMFDRMKTEEGVIDMQAYHAKMMGGGRMMQEDMSQPNK